MKILVNSRRALLALGVISAAWGVALAPAYAQDTKSPSKEELMGEMDADMKAVMSKLTELGAKPLETLTPEEARSQPTPGDAVMAVRKEKGKPVDPIKLKDVKDVQIEGAAGQIPGRIYTPEGEGPFPVILYFHGGGWVIADLDTYDASARALAKGADAIVVSSHYRQAPEHKFPAAHDDAFAAYQWVLKNIKDHNGDPMRVAVAGESAGGNLAANVSMAARDKGVQMPVHQLLVYPVASNNMMSEAYVENTNAVPLSKAGMEWFVKHVFDSPDQTKDPRLNLVGANLKGLPPTTIILAEIDPLRSDGELLAEKLEAAGVDAEVESYDGVTHEFFGMAAAVDDAEDAQGVAFKALTDAFEDDDDDKDEKAEDAGDKKSQ